MSSGHIFWQAYLFELTKGMLSSRTLSDGYEALEIWPVWLKIFTFHLIFTNWNLNSQMAGGYYNG